ncbi:MAG: biotin/lipoyl-containing protein, partial [Gammaproteobacteria bacterium]
MAEIRIPDLGDFDEVVVVEVHVTEGDSIQEGDPILTLETEKAAMDVPSTVSGVVENVVVGIGDKVSNGDLVSNVSPQMGQDSEIPMKSND